MGASGTATTARAGAAPTSNVEFWQEKIDKNRVRDARVEQALHQDGWRILTFWQCEGRIWIGSGADCHAFSATQNEGKGRAESFGIGASLRKSKLKDSAEAFLLI